MWTNNPNKTKTIERNWIADSKRRFKALSKKVMDIPLPELVENIDSDQEAAITAFMDTMRAEAIGLFVSSDWQNEYQDQAYKRGIENATADLKSSLSANEVAEYPMLNLEASAVMTTSVHAAELNFLHDRANEKLSGWVDSLLQDTRSILHEDLGVVSVDDIHSAIQKRIEVTTSRSVVIAVTEVSQAAQRSAIKEAQQFAISSDEDVKVRWITVLDSRVRHLHAGWHGTLMSVEQAARNITISPWNCRCGTKVVIMSKTTEKQQEAFKIQRLTLLKRESKAA